MGSCETSWKIGPSTTLTLAEFEKRKHLSVLPSSESPTPLVICLDDSNDDDDDLVIIDNSGDDQEESSEDQSGISDGADEYEIESVSDNEWNFQTISDDDDNDNTPFKKRICYRCPSKTTGSFKNEKLSFAHIKRHVLPNIFACPICKRSFLKFTHCVSHEIRVHNSPLECSITAIKDSSSPSSAIAKAKQHMKKCQDKQTGSSSRSKNKGVTEDEETDPEDTTFYDNRFVRSSSIYPYKGPPVTSFVQCYEIQLSNPNLKGKEANRIAQKAVDIHIENVKSKMVTNKCK